MYKLHISKYIPRELLKIIIYDYSDIETVTLLYKCLPFEQTFIKNVSKGFQWSCENGNLNVVKWLYKKRKEDLEKNQNLFEKICFSSTIDVVKWYFKEKNIKTNDERVYNILRKIIFTNTEREYLIATYLIGKLSGIILNKMYFKICLHDNTKFIEYIIDKNIVEPLVITKSFTIICNNGNIFLMKKIYDLYEIDKKNLEKSLVNVVSSRMEKNLRKKIILWIYEKNIINVQICFEKILSIRSVDSLKMCKFVGKICGVIYKR